jgi:hypothetical protein
LVDGGDDRFDPPGVDLAAVQGEAQPPAQGFRQCGALVIVEECLAG